MWLHSWLLVMLWQSVCLTLLCWVCSLCSSLVCCSWKHACRHALTSTYHSFRNLHLMFQPWCVWFGDIDKHIRTFRYGKQRLWNDHDCGSYFNKALQKIKTKFHQSIFIYIWEKFWYLWLKKGSHVHDK
jgi:hypothetical protein